MVSYRNDTIVAKKYYIGEYEYTDSVEANRKKEVTYISSPTGLVAAKVKIDAESKFYYVLTDHLGSITQLLDSNGYMLMVNGSKFTYDAWGRLRDVTKSNVYDISSIEAKFHILDRGYCGHEHLLEHGIINMNGRIYDPVVGQFMQADNYIQTPEDYIGYNRYSYCRYNPFKYVDPSGEQLVHSPGPSDGTCYDLEGTGALLWAMISVEALEHSYELRYRNAKGELSITTFTDSDVKTAIDQQAKNEKDGTISNRETGTDNDGKSSVNRSTEVKRPITAQEKEELLKNADEYNKNEASKNTEYVNSFLELVFSFTSKTDDAVATAFCPRKFGYDNTNESFVLFSEDNGQIFALAVEGVTRQENGRVFMYMSPSIINSNNIDYQKRVYLHELIHVSQYLNGATKDQIDAMETYADENEIWYNDIYFIRKLTYPRR